MDNNNKKVLNSEELLENIFYYMNRLFEEKEFSSTITLLTDLGRSLVNSDRASFWFRDKRSRKYWTMAAIDNGKITVDEGTGIVGATIENGETILINNTYEDDRFNPNVDKETGYVTKSILCLPVSNTEGEVIGAYQVINKFDNEGNDSEFDEADIKRLSLVAVFGGKTLESYVLYNNVFYDELTGLKNRRGFYNFYNNRIIPIILKGSASIIMGDIDFFKKVNDEYGHNAGDAVLMHIAAIMDCSIGIDDEVIRWGGEEFIILLANKTIGEATYFAENLRRRIENSVCEFEGKEIKVTMSFGVDEIDYELTSDDNINKVDEKLYEAKNTGRNKVV